jgi:hypothetical protein
MVRQLLGDAIARAIVAVDNDHPGQGAATLAVHGEGHVLNKGYATRALAS